MIVHSNHYLERKVYVDRDNRYAFIKSLQVLGKNSSFDNLFEGSAAFN